MPEDLNFSGGGGESSHATAVKAIFKRWDTDGDGNVNLEELTKIMMGLGPFSEKDVAKMMKEADKDNSGTIDVGEFVDWITQGTTSYLGRASVNMRAEGLYLPKKQMEYIKDAFRVFDADRNGYITEEEFASVLAAMGQTVSPEDIKKTVGEIDKDGNGRIYFDEFLFHEAMKATSPHEQQLRKEFYRLSKGGQDFISRSDFNAEYGDKLGGSILDAGDKNKDGKMCFKEFKKAMDSRGGDGDV